MSRSREISPQAGGTGASGTERAAFVSRLQVILRQWPSADRLARAMGVSPSAFRKWLKGEAEPSRERLVALANAAKVSIGWLATGEGTAPDFHASGHPGRGLPAESDFERFVRLPRRPTAAAAGASTPSQPAWEDSEYIALRQDWVRDAVGVDPAQVGLELAVGDSMAPTIHHGNVLLLDVGDGAFAQFGVYVVEIAGERLVKRVQRKLDGSVVLISDNPSYERDHLSPEAAGDIRVIGRVVWIGGRI